MLLHENIKKYREEKKISQRELARRINMSGQMISKIEKAETTPSFDTITKIATALNVNITDLIAEDTAQELAKENVHKFMADIFKDTKTLSLESLLYDCGFFIRQDLTTNEYVYISYGDEIYKIHSNDFQKIKAYIPNKVKNDLIDILSLLTKEGE